MTVLVNWPFLQHGQRRQGRRLDGHAVAAGVGDRLAARREAARLPLGVLDLQLLQLLQHLEGAVVLGVSGRQGVGGQGQDVGVVLGILDVVADVLDRLVQLRAVCRPLSSSDQAT